MIHPWMEYDGTGFSLFSDKMVEVPPSPTFPKPHQFLAMARPFLLNYLSKVWLLTLPQALYSNRSLVSVSPKKRRRGWHPVEASAVVTCAVSSCEFCQVPTVPGAQATGCRANGETFCVSIMARCCKTGIPCPEVFCPGICWAPWKNSAITVQSQGAVRSSAVTQIGRGATTTPVTSGHAESATGALRADNKCQWRNKRSKKCGWLCWLGFGQGLPRSTKYHQKCIFQGSHRLAQGVHINPCKLYCKTP